MPLILYTPTIAKKLFSDVIRINEIKINEICDAINNFYNNMIKIRPNRHYDRNAIVQISIWYGRHDKIT